MGKISLRIADLRRKHHITQQELADNIGVSFQTISKWETEIGMEYQKLCRHEGLEKKWPTELAMQGRDYAVAIKTAHIMQKPGLTNVDVRMNDKVEFITTQSPDYEKTKNDFITYNDWTSGISNDEKEKMILHLLTHGLSRREAEDYCDRNVKIADFFSENPTAGYTFMKGQMISYGKKADTPT